MASLTLKAITKRFGKVMALSRVDLDVKNGEFCVLLGPSGCGKSTLLNIIAGLIPQDQGSVLLDGQSVDRLAPRDRDIAMVFQSYALYPHMSVAQNLSFGLRMRGISKSTIRESVQWAARLLGIEDLLDRKPRELSGGQRQRVAMGRALVRRPRLFLLDEPLSNLDARLRANVRLELKQMHHQIQGTIVYVTHDQVEAMTLGDKVVVMRDGKVHQAGPPEAIYAYPSDTFVATFIGSPEINLYRGMLVRKDGIPHFQGAGFFLNLERHKIDINEGEVKVGIRPEDIGTGQDKAMALMAEVEMISNVGSEKYIHARLGDEVLTFRAPKDTALQPGNVVPLAIDPGRIHIFHKGRRV
ncbi:MAG: ABC transporter ATP-binding protein [Desulfobacteraceae bacterium]|nr:MAG: ABC transporter ATP-binding protein [Desulfobacteraceae bacterium]